MPEPYGVDISGNFVPGATYIILTEGTTDWNYVAGTGHAAFPPVEDIVYKVGDIITCVNPNSDDSTGDGTARRVELAGSLITGSTYLIVQLGNTNWNSAAGTSGVVYKEGDVFKASNAGSGTGVVSRVTANVGRIGGKALKANLERNGVDLAFRDVPTKDPVLYLKVSPIVTKIVGSTSLVPETWYKIRSLEGSDFTVAGAPTNTVGTVFRATQPVGATSFAPTVVSNGTFDTDLSSWTAVGSGVLTWNPAGTMTVDATGGITQIAQQLISVNVGEPYKLRATHLGGGINSPSTDFSIEILDSTLATTYVNLAKADLSPLGTPGYVDADFTPLTDTLLVKISAFNCTPEWDDVSVRQITVSNGTAYEVDHEADPSSIDRLEKGLATGIGVNTDIPYYTLDVNNDIKTLVAQATNSASFDNIVFLADEGKITTKGGPIHITLTGDNPVVRMDRMRTDDIAFSDNYIEGLNSNESIQFRPHSNGTIQLKANTNVEGNLFVERDILIDGNLSYADNIILGDSTLATVVINADFQQGIIPGKDNAYDMGQDERDSSPRAWGNIYSPDLSNVKRLLPESMTVSDQIYMGGADNEIVALQSNDPVIISPDTGIFNIESIKIEGDILTNLISTPALDATAIASSIADYNLGDPDAQAIWDDSATGVTVTVVGPGSTVQGTREGKLGDFFDDPSNPDIINTDDSTIVVKIGNDSTVTLNDQLWYHTAVKPAVFADETLYEMFGNGASLDAKPFTLGSTDNGYIKFVGSNGIVIPAGTSAEREYTEIGETRWNTEEKVMECYDGSVYIISTGPGEVVNTNLMTDLAIARSLMFG